MKVRDSYGNIVPNATVNWRATTNSGGGAPSLSASSSTTGQDGTTQIIATLQTQTGATNMGAAQVIASVASGASVTFALTAIAGAPASLTKVYGDQQTGVVNTQLKSLIGVHVADTYGNPVDALVNFVVTAGSGAVLPASTQSGSTGTTAVQWTLGPTVGTQTVSAQVGSGLSVTFTATATGLPTMTWSDTTLSVQGSFQIFEAVSGLSSSNVVMGGSDNRVVRFDGTNWTDLGPVSGDTYLTINGLWMSPTGDIYGVGVSGTPTQHGVIEWFAGGVWHETASLGGDLAGIWGASESDIFAVGLSGTILRYSGVTNTWSKMAVPTPANVGFFGVWGTGAADVFVVGDFGTILHFNGTAWTQMPSPKVPTTGNLRAVWGRSSTDVFAVGEGGEILHFDGTGWKALQSGTPYTLAGIGGTPLGNVYATGYNGTLLSYDGQAWTQVPIASSSASLAAVWGAPNGQVFAVGDPWRVVRGTP